MLSESRKADRATMAAMVEQLCAEQGATVERSEYDREIHLDINIGGARVGIEFDGSAFNSQKDCFCMPWNTDFGSKSHFTAAFSRAVGGEVNPSHGAKCMGFANGIDALLDRLRLAMQCINRGDALATGPLPFTGESREPAKIIRQGFRAIGEASDRTISAAEFQRAAYEQNIPQSGLTAFRHPDGRWQMYARPAVAA